jgi:hypothetical protein
MNCCLASINFMSTRYNAVIEFSINTENIF